MTKFYIYKYYKGDKVVYVGQTIRPVTRNSEHKASSSWYEGHTDYVIAEVPNKTTMDMYELYLINTLDPVGNTANARADEMGIELPELNFVDGVTLINELCDIEPKLNRVRRKSKRAKKDTRSATASVEKLLSQRCDIEYIQGSGFNTFIVTLIGKDVCIDDASESFHSDFIESDVQLLNTWKTGVCYCMMTFIVPVRGFYNTTKVFIDRYRDQYYGAAPELTLEDIPDDIIELNGLPNVPVSA